MLLLRLKEKEARNDLSSEGKGHVPFQISVKDTPELKVLHLQVPTSDSDLGAMLNFKSNASQLHTNYTPSSPPSK